MTASQIVFYIIAAFMLVTGLLSVTTTKIFRSAIWLLFSLIGVASLYFWLDVQFIAAVQIVVYVGGIVVLIIFSIFLTQKAGDEMPLPFRSRSVFSMLAVMLGFALAYSPIYQYKFTARSAETLHANVADIGLQMLSTKENGYALPFEVVSMLLLAAMVGCIVIAMKSKVDIETKKGEPLRHRDHKKSTKYERGFS